MTSIDDEYATWRTSSDAMRLCYQHFLWRELYKSNIHPSIKLPTKTDLRIAEVAAGHGLWAIEVAEEFPAAQIEASDITLNLLPPEPDLPANLTMRKWSFFDPVPEEWKSSFDLVHVRLLIQIFAGQQDPRPVLLKFVSMLKPGGYLQWDEYDYAYIMTNNMLYSTTNPSLTPNPKITHPSSNKLAQLLIDTFRWPTEHFQALSDYYTAAGLVEVADHRRGPPRAMFRAFYEHWFALQVQMISIYDAMAPQAGKEARALVTQMKRDAEVDGVFTSKMTKIVVGRRPLADVPAILHKVS